MLHYVVQQYVGSERRFASTRVDELANVFRSKEDGAALDWLRRRVTGKQHPRILGEICDGLEGVRAKVFWPAFELRYDRDKGPGQKIARWLTEWADALNKARDPAEFVRGANALREQISRKFESVLGDGIEFQPGEVLVDIPPPGKDQADNIWIQIDERKRPIRPIHDISPLADDVRNAFRLWARRLRIFLAPSAWSRVLRLGLSEQDVRDRFERALAQLERDLDPQGYFDFDVDAL